MKFRSAYSVVDRVRLCCEDESRTHSEFKDECDINVIMKRFGVTGVVPQNVRPPQYGDFRAVVDFQSAMNAIVEAQNSFKKMPSDTRARFNNDPQRFLEFCSKPENLDEMRKLGLAVPKVAPAAATGTS